MPLLRSGWFVCVWLLLPATVYAQEADLASKARKVLETYCHRCHGKDGTADGGFDALDVKKMIARRKVIARDPARSRLLRRVKDGDMPPEGHTPRPGKDDIALLERWIQEGAADFPAPPQAKRPFVGEKDVYGAIDAHLDELDGEDWQYQRYFVLTNLHNDPSVSDADLRLHRAGVAKLLNSLSWRRRIVLPRVIDTRGVVLAIDLRDLDWDVSGAWTTLTSVGPRDQTPVYQGNPYALTHDRWPASAEINRLARRVYQRTRTEVPTVRADWFLATASLPPIYHELLELPDNAAALEKRLRVDVALNFRRNTLKRAGFEKSGVSARANRLVERHESAYGAYWKSYDFKSGEGRGNLIQFPLVPRNLYPVGRVPFEDQAFEHDGGEIIFHLPNGLQGYLLVDGKDRRIDEGPADVVRDRNETAGKSTIIINGLSCIGCHRHGMIDGFQDDIRQGTTAQGEAKALVRRLYPEAKVLQRLIDEDRDLFLRALERTIGPSLRVGPDKNKDLTLFPEPISLLAGPFLKGHLTLADGARELGVENPDDLQRAIRDHQTLQDLGLRPWLVGGVIRREKWQSTEGFTSVFQETARILRRGTPFRASR